MFSKDHASEQGTPALIPFYFMQIYSSYPKHIAGLQLMPSNHTHTLIHVSIAIPYVNCQPRFISYGVTAFCILSRPTAMFCSVRYYSILLLASQR